MDLVLLLISYLLDFMQVFIVSILILMDLVLLRSKAEEKLMWLLGFNPYFNGSSTSTVFVMAQVRKVITFQSLF